MVASNDSNPGVWALASNEYVALTNTFPTRTTYSVGPDTLAITDNTTLDGQATFTLVYL